MTTNADAFGAARSAVAIPTEKLQRGEPQLLLVATDGELYGHHQPFRDKFLAHLLKTAGPHSAIVPTFPARWLRDHPPRRTSASVSEPRGAAITAWRAGRRLPAARRGQPLEAHSASPSTAAAAIDARYVAALRPYIDRPVGAARPLDPCDVGRAVRRRVDSGVRLAACPRKIRRIYMLLEAQRQRQRMFTSCGWFFDDFDRIEPKNNVAYAAQAVRLTHQATGTTWPPRRGRAYSRSSVGEPAARRHGLRLLSGAGGRREAQRIARRSLARTN